MDPPLTLIDNHKDPEQDIWTTPRDGQHWDECRDMLKSHDKKELNGWKDEINTQLLVVCQVPAMKDIS